MPQKTASRTAAVWAYCLNYLAGAGFLLHALANLIGWDNLANHSRSEGYYNLALSVVFFSIGTVFMAKHLMARHCKG